MKKTVLISAILAVFIPVISAKAPKPAHEKKPGHFHKIFHHKKKAAKKPKNATGPTLPPPVDEN